MLRQMGLVLLFLGCFSAAMAAGLEKSGKAEGPHGGVFCAVQECEIGLVEVLIKDRLLHLWFFNEGEQKPQPMVVPQAKLLLLTAPPAPVGSAKNASISPKDIRDVILLADRNQEGKGSPKGSFHYSGPWTDPKIDACGWVYVAGQLRPFRIVYPEGLHIHCPWRSAASSGSGKNPNFGSSSASASSGRPIDSSSSSARPPVRPVDSSGSARPIDSSSSTARPPVRPVDSSGSARPIDSSSSAARPIDSSSSASGAYR